MSNPGFTEKFPVHGTHITLHDNGMFSVDTGRGNVDENEIARLNMVTNGEKENSLVQLDIESEALDNWGDAVVNDAFVNRSVQLVSRLGLYADNEGFLTSVKIKQKITAGMGRTIQILETGSLVSFFGENVSACQYSLLTGLFHSVKANLESQGLQTTATEAIFMKVLGELNLDAEKHFEYIQIMDKAAELLWWLTPGPQNQSLWGDIEAHLHNRSEQSHQFPFLLFAGAVMQDSVMQQVMMQHLLPQGELTIATAPTEVTLQDKEAVFAQLTNNPELLLQFILHLMSSTSHVQLTRRIRERLRHPLEKIHREKLQSLEKSW